MIFTIINWIKLGIFVLFRVLFWFTVVSVPFRKNSMLWIIMVVKNNQLLSASQWRRADDPEAFVTLLDCKLFAFFIKTPLKT